MMENKHTIYFNMCHHYRKIFNAKPTVDTSPPKALQNKSNAQWTFSRNPSPFRTKTPIQANVNTFPKEPYLTQDNGTITCKYYYQHHNKKQENKNSDKLCNVPSKPFNPRILNTNVQSKLRNLRVYYPPRRKKVVKVTESSPSSPQNVTDNKEEIIRRPTFTDKSPLKSSKRQQLLAVMDHHSYSEESSEDSAYNEGEGVLSSDSRGSTPQNLSNKHQPAKLTVTDNNQPKIIDTSMNKMNDEVIYIQFLKDITNDILKKNIFTNKALKNVFQHHVQINKYELEMEKMQKEISKLQERLGVPKDDKQDDENYGLAKDSSFSESLKSTETSPKNSSRANSLSVDHTPETSPEVDEENLVEDEATSASKENDYSEDFSDFDNHSIASQISNRDPSEDHDSYDSEANDEISSVSENDEIEDDKNDDDVDDSIVDEENISQGDDLKSESGSEISEVS